MRLLRKAENSMIFICLTPNPKGEHLKIIELGFTERTQEYKYS